MGAAARQFRQRLGVPRAGPHQWLLGGIRLGQGVCGRPQTIGAVGFQVHDKPRINHDFQQLVGGGSG